MAVTRVYQGERRTNTFLKEYYFDYVVDEIIKNIIRGNEELE